MTAVQLLVVEITGTPRKVNSIRSFCGSTPSGMNLQKASRNRPLGPWLATPGSRLVRGKAMRGGTGNRVVGSGPRNRRVSAFVEVGPNVRFPLSLTNALPYDCPKKGNVNPTGNVTWIEAPFGMFKGVALAGAGGLSLLMMMFPMATVCPAPTVTAI